MGWGYERFINMARAKTEEEFDESAIRRFKERIMPEPMSGCILWLGEIDPNGYGTHNRRSKTFKAHKFSYELYKGPVPKGLELDHLCRVRSCVNPDHLEPVTKAENIRRSHKFPRLNKTATQCAYGHSYLDDTVKLRFDGRNKGGRRCLICTKIQNKKRSEKRTEMRDAARGIKMLARKKTIVFSKEVS